MVSIGPFQRLTSASIPTDVKWVVLKPGNPSTYLKDKEQGETTRLLTGPGPLPTKTPDPSRGFGLLGFVVDATFFSQSDAVDYLAGLLVPDSKSRVLVTNDLLTGFIDDDYGSRVDTSTAGNFPPYVEEDYFTWTWQGRKNAYFEFSVFFGRDSSHAHGDPNCPPAFGLNVGSYSTVAFAQDYIDSLWPFVDHGSGGIMQIDFGTNPGLEPPLSPTPPAGVTIITCQTNF